jgi:UDP-glucuronate 4-epimerase
MLKGEPIPVFGDGTTKRDYTYISDIVDGVLACTNRELGYEILNLGNSNPITLENLITVLEEVMRTKAEIQRLPDQPGDVPLTCADVTKAQKILGYSPKVPLKIGIQNFLSWFLSSEERAYGAGECA